MRCDKEKETGSFRFRRYKLPPEAFLVGRGHETEPTDLVDEETWESLTCLPDDVSLRISEHHGTLLQKANQVLEHWIAMVLDLQQLTSAQDVLVIACSDAFDDFQASVYAMLTGFYRQSISALRTALEEVLAGIYFKVCPDEEKEEKWKTGAPEGRLSVREIRQRLTQKEPFSSLEEEKQSIFEKHGWIDDLYSKLSAFIHGRPSYRDKKGRHIPASNVRLWGGSSGPVYVPITGKSG